MLGEAGAAQRSVDVSEVIEEITEQPGWESGNAIALFFETARAAASRGPSRAAWPAQLQIILALQAEPAAIVIPGEATDDAAPFSAAASDLSSRGRTASTVMWAPEAWEDGESGLDQRTPDLSDVIQAIIDEPGWDAGNALALFFKDTTAGGDRIVEAFEGAPGAAARLVVVALDPSGAEFQFELAVCMPEDLNPNLEGNDAPTDRSWRTTARAASTIRSKGLPPSAATPRPASAAR